MKKTLILFVSLMTILSGKTLLAQCYANAGPDLNNCGTTVPLSGFYSGASGSTVVWATTYPGAVFSDPNTVNPTLTIPAFTQTTQVVLTFTENNTSIPCSYTDTLIVNLSEVPDAYAGEDDTVCGKLYTMQAINSLTNGVGSWVAVTKPYLYASCDWTPYNSNNATLSVSDYGVWQFEWREQNLDNLTCVDRDTVTIEFLLVPYPDAGPDTSVCGNWVHLSAQSSNPGYWSNDAYLSAWYDTQNGTLCLACAENPDVWAYYPSENDTVTYYWTEYNGVCYGWDSTTVYFGSIQPAVALVDAEDSIACGRVFYDLNAIMPAYGTGYWVDDVPNTVYDPSPNNTMPNSVTIGLGTYGMHNFSWITANGNCRDTSDVVPVRFMEQPEANAGGNYWPGLFGPNSDIKTDTVCGLNYKLWATPSVGSGFWFATDTSNVLFVETGGPTPTSNPHDSLYILGYGNYSVFNTSVSYREFYWQENNQGVCTDSDTLRIYFAPRPSGEFSILPFACADSQLVIANTWPYPNDVDYGVTTFNWSFPGLICNAGNLNQDTLMLVTPDNLPHNVSLITENQWGCISGIYFQTVYPAGIYSPVNGSLTGTIPEPNSILVAGYDAVTKEMVESVHPDNSGAYSLFLPYGNNYYIKASNEDALENPGIASTYYGDSWTWDHAQLVQPVACDVTIANITMLTFTPANNGNCRVFGKVVYDSGGPVKDINVYLQYNTIYTLAGMTNTNYMGQYELSGCEPGSYALYIDIPALPMVTTHHFTILAGDTVVPNLNFIVDTTATKDYGFGIYADTTSGLSDLQTEFSAFRVYPNPASDYIVVESTESGNEPVLCTLFDSKGVLLLQRELEPQTSSVLEEIAALMPGVYYVRLTSGNTIYVKKIIRE